ncbi:MAG: PadR family transcriptional regulator [Desulfurococcales archaeon]|nr:PadR family transcriptional regulator [Desulfurococcales archaeon]
MDAKTPRPLARLRRKTTIENLWLYVIAALLSEGETYAYRVRKVVEEKFGFKPSTVTLYTVIYRLEKEGLLERDPTGVYRVTERGVEAFKEGVDYLQETVSKLRRVAWGGSHGP